MMKTVILDVAAPDDALTAFSKAWKTGKAEKQARISFATPELLWQVLTAKRWELLRTLCGAGVVSIRETARRVNRDVKAVHSDVTTLVNAGVLRRSDGGIEFPYDAVHVDFVLKAA
jgi:predicted transcriptional regulator